MYHVEPFFLAALHRAVVSTVAGKLKYSNYEEI